MRFIKKDLHTNIIILIKFMINFIFNRRLNFIFYGLSCKKYRIEFLNIIHFYKRKKRTEISASQQGGISRVTKTNCKS